MSPSPTSAGPATGRLAALLAAVLLLISLVAAGLTAAPAVAQPSAPGDAPIDPAEEPVGEPVTPGAGTGRLAGDTRVGTAVAIAQRAFPDGAATAYLANADEPVDAVVGGSLTDGPILLVPACDLPAAVAAELARLAPQEVIALGGTVAVCDRVLASAASAAGIDGDGGDGDGGDGDQPDAVVTASAEVLDATTAPPFTVDVTDPGILYEGGAFDHDVRLTGTDGDVVLDDPRFSAVMVDGDGQLVVTGRGCGPNVFEGDVEIVCQDDFLYLEVAEGQTTIQTLTLHTDDAAVGETPVRPGTYVLDQPVRWESDTTDPAEGDVAFDDGSATIRITYTVAEPTGGDIQPAAVVTWSTPEGDFRTDGHSLADLERIRDGVDRGAHIGIPNGVIHRGDGGINLGRDWHLSDVEIVDVTMEVCDGTADHVSEHLEDFLAIGRYCPWGAVPIAIETSD